MSVSILSGVDVDEAGEQFANQSGTKAMRQVGLYAC